MGWGERRDRPTSPVSDRRTSQTVDVLVVDDSVVVRHLVTRVIDAEPGFRVVGEAAEGARAITLARALRPDVMVLDLAMPGMDGFETLDTLRRDDLGLRIVVFANVETDERARIESLVSEAGAELVIKPTGVADAGQAMVAIRRQLLEVLGRPSPDPDPLPAPPPSRTPAPAPARARAGGAASSQTDRPAVKAVVVAASTGGPNALELTLGAITDLTVPIFVVQHISGAFSGRLAARLDGVCRFPVTEAVDGQQPEPGHAYVSPGGIHLMLERERGAVVMRLRDRPPVNSCRPSADVLFASSAEVYGADQLGVVLTGIGQDGLDGCRALADRGAAILVQDEASSVVWGMPGVVAQAGLADEILPLESIGPWVERLIHYRSRPSRLAAGTP